MRRPRIALIARAFVLASFVGFPGAGAFGQSFIRGDADQNGVVELIDAVNVFGSLFLGDPPPSVWTLRTPTTMAASISPMASSISASSFSAGTRRRPPFRTAAETPRTMTSIARASRSARDRTS